ncbi:hypothetical protein PR048_014780 [Dryococelus australis]|uniref:Reverse transcriptase domain-containing protein n=1 Tax=Dryococelus australis TaxID=614101 RepID=A0ABQ9HF46_9NEOP|nr:hypothetical protein PR048_014780 [Dryococelus australis]
MAIFSLFINDLPAVTTNAKHRLYADDFRIYVSALSNLLVNAIDDINSDLQSIHIWSQPVSGYLLRLAVRMLRCIKGASIQGDIIENFTFPFLLSAKKLQLSTYSDLLLVPSALAPVVAIFSYLLTHLLFNRLRRLAVVSETAIVHDGAAPRNFFSSRWLAADIKLSRCFDAERESSLRSRRRQVIKSSRREVSKRHGARGTAFGIRLDDPDPRENPPTGGIVRHDSHVRKSGSDQIEPGSPWREASRLTDQPPPARRHYRSTSEVTSPRLAESLTRDDVLSGVLRRLQKARLCCRRAADLTAGQDSKILDWIELGLDSTRSELGVNSYRKQAFKYRRRVFSGISRFPRTCIPEPAPYSPRWTLIGCQDLDVKGPPKPFHSPLWLVTSRHALLVPPFTESFKVHHSILPAVNIFQELGAPNMPYTSVDDEAYSLSIIANDVFTGNCNRLKDIGKSVGIMGILGMFASWPAAGPFYSQHIFTFSCRHVAAAAKYRMFALADWLQCTRELSGRPVPQRRRADIVRTRAPGLIRLRIKGKILKSLKKCSLYRQQPRATRVDTGRRRRSVVPRRQEVSCGLKLNHLTSGVVVAGSFGRRREGGGDVACECLRCRNPTPADSTPPLPPRLNIQQAGSRRVAQAARSVEAARDTGVYKRAARTLATGAGPTLSSAFTRPWSRGHFMPTSISPAFAPHECDALACKATEESDIENGQAHSYNSGSCNGNVSAESLTKAHCRRQGCAPVQCFAHRGDENVDVHVSDSPSTPTLLGLRCAKFLQPGGGLKKRCSRAKDAATPPAQRQLPRSL